jgi:hypothetical protein
MSVAHPSRVTPETIDLIGYWRLVAVTNWTDGVLTNAHAMGPRPGGYITYSPAGRMMVVLDRRSVGEAKLKGRYSPEPIFAYCGGFTRTGGVVVHHLEMCTTVGDIGTDYVRRIEVAGDHLFLCIEPVTKGDNTYVSKLEWERCPPL